MLQRTIQLDRTGTYREAWKVVLSEWRHDEFPKAQVEHVGATSVPGLLTKGDLDLQVSVSEQDFTEAVVTLRSIYAIHQPENWTGSFASFRLSQDAEIPVGIQLVVQCSADDVFVKIRNLLVARPETVKELNLLKQSYLITGVNC